MTATVVELLEEPPDLPVDQVARIGLELLQEQTEILQRNKLVENELVDSKEEISQLKHVISYKDLLLQSYMRDESASPSPSMEAQTENGDNPQIDADLLYEKLCELQRENADLRRGQQILHERVGAMSGELHCVKEQMMQVSEDLRKTVDVVAQQQEEIDSLRSHMSILQQRNNSITSELEELQENLLYTSESQRELKEEVSGLEKAYKDILVSIDDTRQKYHSLSLSMEDSSIVHSFNMECDENYFENFDETLDKSNGNDLTVPVNVPTESSPLPTIKKPRPQSDVKINETSKFGPREPVARRVSTGTQFTNEEPVEGTISMGKPGVPGTTDLETALRKLSNHQS